MNAGSAGQPPADGGVAVAGDPVAAGREVPETAVSLMMGIPSPDLALLAVLAGCDCVILDCEHGFPLDNTMRMMVLAVKAGGGRCLVRIPKSAVDQVGVLADIGLDGIVLSGPQRLQDMATVLELASFPDLGVRSVNPFVPAAGTPGDISRLRVSADSFELWAMAENPSFLDELEALSAAAGRADGWAGIIIGPYDLAASLACDPDPDDPVLLDAVLRLTRAAKALGVRSGLFVRDGAALARWRSRGVDPDLAVVGYDRDAWFHECRSRVAGARQAMAEETQATAQEDSMRKPT